jgi:two-component system cell cycle response regulator
VEFAESVIKAAVAVIQRAQALETSRADNARLEALAHTDPLTQTLNRRAMMLRLTAEVDRVRRYDSVVTLLLLDLDHFKKINDTYGHLVGDEVLREVATLLSHAVRSVDVVARYGGEEFALILPGVRSGRAQDLLERFRRVVAATPIHLSGRPRPVSVTISIGVASFPEDGVAAAEVLACADRRLYDAKEGGRDRVVGPPRATARPAGQRGDEDSQEILTSVGPIIPPDL